MWFGYRNRSVDLCWGTKTAEYCVGWGGWGQMAFVINEHQHPYTGLKGSSDLGFYWNTDELEHNDGAQLLAPHIYRDTDRFGIFVANWVIVALYTGLWLAALVIWHRRKHRMTNLHS